METTTVRIPKELQRKVREVAAKDKLSVRQYVRWALETMLKMEVVYSEFEGSMTNAQKTSNPKLSKV